MSVLGSVCRVGVTRCCGGICRLVKQLPFLPSPHDMTAYKACGVLFQTFSRHIGSLNRKVGRWADVSRILRTVAAAGVLSL